MVATAVHSVTVVFWKETAFPFWRDTDRRWNRNAADVFRHCSDNDNNNNNIIIIIIIKIVHKVQ